MKISPVPMGFYSGQNLVDRVTLSVGETNAVLDLAPLTSAMPARQITFGRLMMNAEGYFAAEPYFYCPPGAMCAQPDYILLGEQLTGVYHAGINGAPATIDLKFQGQSYHLSGFRIVIDPPPIPILPLK
jgi:hypothetical protein